MIKIVLAMMLLDFVSGMAKAFHLGTANSKKDISKKAFFLIFLCIGMCFDFMCVSIGMPAVITTGFGDITATHVMSLFIIGVEGISIFENAAMCGVPLPKFLKEKLEQLQDL